MLAKLDAFYAENAAWLAGVFSIAGQDGTIADFCDCGCEADACLAQVQGAQLLARAAGDVGRFDAATPGLLGRIRG